MSKRTKPGDKHTDEYGQEFTFEFVASYTVNEWTITVYHERNDDELESVPDHFTVEVFEIDEVTMVKHGLDAKEMAQAILGNMFEL